MFPNLFGGVDIVISNHENFLNIGEGGVGGRMDVERSLGSKMNNG